MNSVTDGVLDTLIARARQALERGDLISARALCEQALQRAPDHPNALLLSGHAAFAVGDWTAAAGFFARCSEVAPQVPSVRFWLGNALRQDGELRGAARAYTEALRLGSTDPACVFNLGLSLAALGDVAGAGQAFVRAARTAGAVADVEAHHRAIDAALQLADRPAPAIPTTAATALRRQRLSIICCSITRAKIEAFRENLTHTFADCDWELVVIDDARSLCEGYQRGIARSNGDLLLLCHDDIEFIGTQTYARLIDAFDGADIVGVAGTTLLNGPAVAWSGHPHFHGWVTHLVDGRLMPTPMSLRAPRIDGAQALDGLFIAARRAVFEQVQFDADTFDGFHFYDIDFSYRAFLAGLRVRIQSDILLIHASAGNFNADYARYAQKFLDKFPSLAVAQRAAPLAFTALASDRDALRGMYAWLAHWTY